MSRSIRRAMIDRDHQQLSLVRQCILLDVSRASVYYRPVPTRAEDLELMALMDRQYLKTPFYGSRRMKAWLLAEGYLVSRSKVRRLMRLMGLEAIYRRPNTSKPAPGHRVYPYLLKGVDVNQVDQVWAADITYIPMAQGFLYLVAIMDWHSRHVLAWKLSNTMDTDFCVAALEQALGKGRPEVFNTDQGAHFTSDAFTQTLQERGIQVSMDGKGRYLDNSVPRRHGKEETLEVPCCMRDEGGPLGTRVQAQVPNHLKLRWSKARVVSVQGKARRTRQVRVKETSGSEPLMTCRKGRDDVKTGKELLAQEKPGRNLFTGQAASGMKVA